MGDATDRKTPVPDGWGATESSAGDARSSKPRKRITLRVAGPALELPTDGGSERLSLPEETSSSELELPPEFAALAREAATRDDAEADPRDGWQRSRSTATIPPPPPRPKSDYPPVARSSESTDSLRLVSARSRPSASQPPGLAEEMHDRFALGDFTGALRAAELILGQEPADHEAAEVAATSRDRLVSFHLARLGGLAAVLDLKVAGAEVRWLGLDHRTGFLLSHVDGTTTVEEIVDLSGMPKHEALRLLAELFEAGAITRIA